MDAPESANALPLFISACLPHQTLFRPIVTVFKNTVNAEMLNSSESFVSSNLRLMCFSPENKTSAKWLFKLMEIQTGYLPPHWSGLWTTLHGCTPPSVRLKRSSTMQKIGRGEEACFNPFKKILSDNCLSQNAWALLKSRTSLSRCVLLVGKLWVHSPLVHQ